MPIQDIKVQEMPIILDGKEYKMRLDMYAIGLLEEHGYGDIFSILNDMEKHKYKNIPILIWAMIQHEDEKLTVKKVSQMIPYSIGFANYFLELIIKASTDNMPVSDPNAQTNPVQGGN